MAPTVYRAARGRGLAAETALETLAPVGIVYGAGPSQEVA